MYVVGRFIIHFPLIPSTPIYDLVYNFVGNRECMAMVVASMRSDTIGLPREAPEYMSSITSELWSISGCVDNYTVDKYANR